MSKTDVIRREDAKHLSKPNFSPDMCQQRRREILLEWQKTRRDEITEKVRDLDESVASESEGEDMDFLQEIGIRKLDKFVATLSTSAESEISNDQESSVGDVELADEGVQSSSGPDALDGCGRGFVKNKIQDEILRDSVNSNLKAGCTVLAPRGRGRGLNLSFGSSRDCQPPSKNTEVSAETKPNKVTTKRKRRAPCGVMLSEWLVDIPDDFEENWMGVFCPVGKRCLIVANGGKTRVFTRRNQYLGHFSSYLPGGNKSHAYNSNGRRGLTILDCFWSDANKIFYALDLISWNSFSFNNCPTEFRYFLLQSKLQETPELQTVSRFNSLPFEGLPFFRVNNLAEIMLTAVPTFPEPIDGVLFYHKDVYYQPEITPLVLWLHLSDVESVLSVHVSPELLTLERVQNPNTRYYLDKPSYAKRENPESRKQDDKVSIDEGYDYGGDDEVPLG